MSGSGVDILAKVEEYLLDDPSIGEDFESFAEKNCAVFEEGEENKLEYMPIFQQFQKLFNDRIESFITSQGSSLEQFVEACEKASEESFALQLIMGITSFDAFKELMLEQKRKVREDTEGKYNVAEK